MRKRLGIFGLALAALLMFGTLSANAAVHFGVSVGPVYPAYPYAYQYPYPSYYPYSYNPYPYYYNPYAYTYPNGGYYWGSGLHWGGHEHHDRDFRGWHDNASHGHVAHRGGGEHRGGEHHHR